MNLEELNKIQHQIDEVRDELITEQAQLESRSEVKRIPGMGGQSL